MYSACQANNVVSRINNLAITYFSDGNQGGLNSQMNIPSALQCCQNCQQAALMDPTLCRFYVYSASNGQCVMETSVNNAQRYTIYINSASTPKLYIGNGAGGVVTFLQ